MTTTNKTTTTTKSNSKPLAPRKAKDAAPVPTFDAIAEAIDHATTGDKQAVAFLRGVSDTRAVAFITKLDTSRAEQPGIDDAESYPPPSDTPAQPIDLYAVAEQMGIPVIPVIVEDGTGNVLEVATKEKAQALKVERPSTAHVYALREAYRLGGTDEEKRTFVRRTLEAFGPIAHGVVRLALRKLLGDEPVCAAIKVAANALPAAQGRVGQGKGRRNEQVVAPDGSYRTERKIGQSKSGMTYVGGFRAPFPAGSRVRITVDLVTE